jgi:hypothetical protein
VDIMQKRKVGYLELTEREKGKVCRKVRETRNDDKNENSKCSHFGLYDWKSSCSIFQRN